MIPKLISLHECFRNLTGGSCFLLSQVSQQASQTQYASWVIYRRMYKCPVKDPQSLKQLATG
jgi:hypothetical protein